MREMKDSGGSWTRSKIKYHCSMKSGNSITSQYIEESGKFPVYGGNGLRGFCSDYTHNGSYLLIGRQGALAGNVHRVNSKFWASEHAIVTTVFRDMSIDYFYYLLLSLNLNQYAFNTAAQPGLAVEKIMNLSIVYPQYKTQTKIANYLDQKCLEIDAITKDIQSQIDTLEQYKRSVITEAVTKGLDPDVEMKDSGISWLEKIPMGWSFPKITAILDYKHPYPIGDGDHGSIKADDYKESGIPFIRVQNLGYLSELDLTNIVYISKEQNMTIANSTLYPNDVIFAKTGATIGKVGIVPSNIEMANTTSHVGKNTVKPEINSRYIYYVLVSNIRYKQFWDIANMKTTRPELSLDEIKTIHVILPKNVGEQSLIVAYLDNKCKEIDSLLKAKQEQLSTLSDYKKSLIYEYVTGKKEVPVE